jgi:hypothetical protein
VPAQSISLAVGVRPLIVVVYLVSSDGHDRASAAAVTYGVKHVGGTQHVGSEGVNRLAITFPHQGLRSEVENHIRIDLPDVLGNLLGVANVHQATVEQASNARRFKQVGCSRRWQSQAHYVGTKLLQPQGEPAALKTSVPRKQHLFPEPECRRGDCQVASLIYQTFHGACSRGP